MRKSIFCLAFIASMISVCTAQKSTTVKKGVLYVNDSAICLIDKLKKKLTDLPSFDIKSLDEKPIGTLRYGMNYLPISAQQKWFQLIMTGLSDTVYLSLDDYSNFQKGSHLVINYEEILGKIIGSYDLVKDNYPQQENFKNLKNDYPDNLPVILQAKTAIEAECVKHTHDPVKSKAGVPVVVELVSTKELAKNQIEIEYAFKQEGNVIGKLLAKGNSAAAKSEDAEYEYSSGIVDLDGGSPLNYQIFNADGCIVARYYTEEKTLFLRKDNAQFKAGDIKKYYKGNIKARIDFIQAFANLLVDKRFL